MENLWVVEWTQVGISAEITNINTTMIRKQGKGDSRWFTDDADSVTMIVSLT